MAGTDLVFIAGQVYESKDAAITALLKQIEVLDHAVNLAARPKPAAYFIEKAKKEIAKQDALNDARRVC